MWSLSAVPPAPVPRPSLRDRVISAATALFHQRGFLAVGVNEIAEAAGATKTSLYRYFRSKDALAIACLDADLATELTVLAALAERYAADPLARLRSIVAEAAGRLAEPHHRDGLPANLAVEIADPAHPIRRACAHSQSVLRARLLDVVREAKLEGPEDLTDSLLLVMHGAASAWQLSGPHGPAAALTRTCEALIAGATPA